MNKLKVNDEVIVIAGKDKGKTGKILRFVKNRVVVEGANMVKKCVKANPNANETGGIYDREAPLHRSNVAILNPVTNKADKVAIKTLEDGRRVRYFKSNDEVVDIID